MRIAQVVCVFPPYKGGISDSAQKIEALLSARHAVVTFAPSTVRPWLRYGHGAFLPQLLWRLKDFDYIYLHYPFFGTAEIVWLFKLFCRRPKLIIHYHMDVISRNWLTKILSWPDRLIRRSLLGMASEIVTASLGYIEESQIKDFYARHPEKFREIPFSVDLKRFQPKLINRDLKNPLLNRTKEIIHYVNDRFIKKDRLNLLFVGALDKAHYFKGIDVLLEALVILKPRRWRLEIVGGGDLRPVYEVMAKRLKLEKQIVFRGRLEGAELIRCFQNADLFILPSINSNEAFGIVLIEALACGVPVIASDLPGVRSVFTAGREGLLAKPNDSRDLADKLEFIFADEARRRKMAGAARQLAAVKYDLKLLEERLEKLFN